MIEKLHEISESEREIVKSKLKEFLEKEQGIQFAYLHGSFLTAKGFHDIDVAVYLNDADFSSLEFELQLETELGECIHYPVDVRVLNSSPLSFRYNVIKEGQLLAVDDDDLRSEFEEATISNYLDFAPFRKIYLQEALGLGL